MALYVIGDLHLTLGVPSKPMNIFKGWDNHIELLKKNWLDNISPEDTIVLAGDTSWGMTLQQARADFDFIDKLPGKKIIFKGNHDYWWNSRKKMEDFFSDNDFSSLYILHNNHFQYGGKYGICGTRGWVNIQGESEPADEKVTAREVQRLEVSIKSAIEAGLKPIVFLHYPPLFGSSYNYDMLDVLYKYKIERCFYGHIHGSGHKIAINGERDNIDFRLISSDFLQFNPFKII